MIKKEGLLSPEDIMLEILDVVKAIKAMIANGMKSEGKVNLGLIDNAALAGALNVSAKTLLKWRRKEKLRSVKICGRVFYKEEDVRQFVERKFI